MNELAVVFVLIVLVVAVFVGCICALESEFPSDEEHYYDA